MGIKEHLLEPMGHYDAADEPSQCLHCDRMFPSLIAVYMHERRKHSKAAVAASVVTSSIRPFLAVRTSTVAK